MVRIACHRVGAPLVGTHSDCINDDSLICVAGNHQGLPLHASPSLPIR